MTGKDFETVKLFRGRMSVALPPDFKDMPDYIAKKKYPSKFRPPVIMMNKDTTVNYLFHLMEQPLPKAELENAAKGFYINIKRTYPKGIFDEIKIIDRVDGKAAWFAYDTPVMDGKLFNVAYLTDIGGKLMYGAFNCILEDKDIWTDRVLYSIASIQEAGGQAL